MNDADFEKLASIIKNLDAQIKGDFSTPSDAIFALHCARDLAAIVEGLAHHVVVHGAR